MAAAASAPRSRRRRPRIGLALGSGSARGWSHIGVIEALREFGIEPDVVCGASIGALVGAALVTGRFAELKRWAEAITWREMLGMLDVSLAGGGLISGRQIVRLLREIGIDGDIESFSTPYAAVGTDLANGREVWFRSGSILDAVRASIAVPGLFSPARNDGRWLLDGGVVNPVPVSLCRALGAEIVIAVNLNGDQLGRWIGEPDRAIADDDDEADEEPRDFFSRIVGQIPPAVRDQVNQIAPHLLSKAGEKVPGYFDVLTGAIDIMQDHITRARLAGEPPDVMLAPRLRAIGLLEYHRASEAIALGRACVEAAGTELTAIAGIARPRAKKTPST
jgi:NTE family protein